jgi:hypothetical protein
MILNVIRRWLETHSYHDGSDEPREHLILWVRREFPLVDAELMVDGLIAVGIGRDYEQVGTVTVHISYSS